jgi:hypothetical protein
VWRSMLDQRIDRTYRWGALLGLQGVLVAEGRYDDVRRLLDDSTVYAADAQRQLYLLDLVAGAPVEREAAAAAAQLRAAYRADPKMSSGRIWYLGLFDARRGAAAELHALAESLAARADRTGERSDHLVARSLAAHAALASGDTAAALTLLEALEPTAPKSLITWQPWESLGPERLALAELRMARGEYTDALRLASSFDAPASIPLVALLRASLQLRVRVARATGRGNLAVDLERRVAALGGRTAPK